jgi:tRNA dimethylallyltransferase
MDPGVIAVIGTTGVGKSNLSIQLAKELDGEVINGDALQVYKQKKSRVKRNAHKKEGRPTLSILSNDVYLIHALKKVYKGLDIITNKMPMDEREGVVHHLMDFLPMDQEYSVLDFKADALNLVRH